MNSDTEIKNLKEDEQQNQQRAAWCCCLPGNGSGNTFWSFVLIVMGSIWLLSSLGIFTAGLNVIIPLLFICLGLFWLVSAKQRSA